MSTVSVIIPNYNHASFLKDRIESVLQQTYQDFEVIILDDCSTDNSKEIIESYRYHPKVTQVIYNYVNSGGVFKQWQKGISFANGLYVWIAESDDWAASDFLEVLVGKISEHTNVGICFAGSNWVDDKGVAGKDLSIYTSDFFRSGTEEIKLHLVKYNTIQNASAAIIKKKLAAKYILKAVRYRACGDWCLYLHILQESDLLFVGKKLNNFRWYHNNTSNNAYKKGLWITESLRILAFSNAYKIKFSKRDLKELLRYWYLKPGQFSSFKKVKLQMLSIFYLSIFTIKTIIYRLQ